MCGCSKSDLQYNMCSSVLLQIQSHFILIYKNLEFPKPRGVVEGRAVSRRMTWESGMYDGASRIFVGSLGHWPEAKLAYWERFAF